MKRLKTHTFILGIDTNYSGLVRMLDAASLGSVFLPIYSPLSVDLAPNAEKLIIIFKLKEFKNQ